LVVRLLNHVVASQEVVGNLLFTELRWCIKGRVIRSPNTKNAHLPKVIALAMQIDPNLGEMVMDIPAIRIAHLREDGGIIVPDRLQDLGGSLWPPPAGHIARHEYHIGLPQRYCERGQGMEVLMDIAKCHDLHKNQTLFTLSKCRRRRL